ncbi:hypothetical protein PM8797T_11129 [Gimesia maris DSM 8797]|nr:hypothetical protein PM8797T_11129 [Gimesia maris DSM 8797]
MSQTTGNCQGNRRLKFQVTNLSCNRGGTHQFHTAMETGETFELEISTTKNTK